MNRGLLLKAYRELWLTTVLLGVALFGLEVVLGYVMPTFAQHFATQMQQMKFFEQIVRAMLGTNEAAALGPELFSSIAWVHPVVLALVWTHAIITCTRVPAGEVDRGTIDVLLGLPISRWQLLVSESAVCVCSAMLILLAAVGGNRLGSSMVASTIMRPDAARLPIVLVNLFMMWLAVGAMAWLVSSFSDRRGRAMMIAFATVLALFLLNYLAQFWAPAARIAFLSVLQYHRPVNALRTGVWPVRDLMILGSAAAVLWTSAAVAFSRRDLITV